MPTPFFLPVAATILGMAALSKRPGEPLFQLPESLRRVEPPKEPNTAKPLRVLVDAACETVGSNGGSYRSFREDIRTEILARLADCSLEEPDIAVNGQPIVALYHAVPRMPGDFDVLSIIGNAIKNGFAVFASLSVLVEGTDVFIMIRKLSEAPRLANSETEWAVLQAPAYAKPLPELRRPMVFAAPPKPDPKSEPKKPQSE